jgi:hypothetical protein
MLILGFLGFGVGVCLSSRLWGGLAWVGLGCAMCDVQGCGLDVLHVELEMVE